MYAGRRLGIWPATAPDGRTRLRGRLIPRLRSGLLELFADAVCDCFHLELGAGDFLQQLVGGVPLPFAPELAEQRARLPAREPGVAELLAQECPELRLEGPRAQVLGHVEAGVDVGQIVD